MDNNNLFDAIMATLSCCLFELPSQYPKPDASPSGAFTSTFFDKSKAWINAPPPSSVTKTSVRNSSIS